MSLVNSAAMSTFDPSTDEATMVPVPLSPGEFTDGVPLATVVLNALPFCGCNPSKFENWTSGI